MAAVEPRCAAPGQRARGLEILRDLLQAVGGGDSLLSIDDVFLQIRETVPRFAGLSLSKIGDLGVHVLDIEELPPMHPSDEEKIELAVAIQARRQAVGQQVEARKAAALESH